LRDEATEVSHNEQMSVMRDDMNFIHELIVETRQNSTYDLVEHITEQQASICATLAQE